MYLPESIEVNERSDIEPESEIKADSFASKGPLMSVVWNQSVLGVKDFF